MSGHSKWANIKNKKEKAEMSTNISASLIGLGVPMLFI